MKKVDYPTARGFNIGIGVITFESHKGSESTLKIWTTTKSDVTMSALYDTVQTSIHYLRIPVHPLQGCGGLGPICPVIIGRELGKPWKGLYRATQRHTGKATLNE